MVDEMVVVKSELILVAGVVFLLKFEFELIEPVVDLFEIAGC